MSCLIDFCFFGHVEERLDKKVMVIFNDVTDWSRNNGSSGLAQNVGGSFCSIS